MAKLIERTLNSIPIGYFLHQTGPTNTLFQILTPNRLRLILSSNRAPIGLFKISDSAAGKIGDIEQKYFTWYSIFNDEYVHLLLQRKKLYFTHENLVVRDIVYFKLTESKMSQDWRIGNWFRQLCSRNNYILQRHLK